MHREINEKSQKIPKTLATSQTLILSNTSSILRVMNFQKVEVHFGLPGTYILTGIFTINYEDELVSSAFKNLLLNRTF